MIDMPHLNKGTKMSKKKTSIFAPLINEILIRPFVLACLIIELDRKKKNIPWKLLNDFSKSVSTNWIWDKETKAHFSKAAKIALREINKRKKVVKK